MKQLAFIAGGVILGLILAAVIGWGVFPMYRYDQSPAGMRADYQDEYIRLTAISFQLTGNLEQATERLNALGTQPVTDPLVELTERFIAAQRSEWIISPLVELAYALDVQTPAMAAFVED